MWIIISVFVFFFFQAEDGIRDYKVTGVQTCALPICGHAVKKGHHQAQGEEARECAHGAHGPAKYPAHRAFDNALERRYLPLAVWRSFTSTPTASTPSSTAPTGSPTCSTGSRRWAWTRSRSPTTATCTGR